ncbi:putative membrane protein [Chlamydia ibidis]|uniref:Membrane protein n=2 Tax=Chlamydia ibidis TaxID=1405396 RepID=A0ABN0MYK7_9CHLA|nr:hypothetical protein [Chlamydia ibidis]EPP34600.1 putative membrane protein [Chlamydia ibidis]EQM62406.1 putative membrane protein [Chlamydia ibidis 10-1398/6]
MSQSFDMLCQSAFRKIFNKQRFVFIFSSLCCFGFVFSLLFKLCSDFISELSIFTLGLVAFFSAFCVICASAVVVQFLLRAEEEERYQSIKEVFCNHWKSLWLSLLVSMPFFICMVVISTVIIFSIFLNSLPWVGRIFHTLLIFVPYLSSMALILLFLTAFASLFFCAPALHVCEGIAYMKLIDCFRGSVLRQGTGFIIAIMPLILSGWLVWDSFYLMSYLVDMSEVHTWSFLVEMIVLVIPVALTLTPALSFFFNFSFNFYQDKEKQQEASEALFRG